MPLKLGKEAQAKFDEACANPDFQGLLEKKGEKRKNWHYRWFVLKDNYLFYCKKQGELPQGIVNLYGSVVKQEGDKPNGFSVLAPKSVSVDAKWTNRTFYFNAPTADSATQWIDVVSVIDYLEVDTKKITKAHDINK